AGLLGGEHVGPAPLVGCLPPLASGRAGFLGGELVGCALLVGSLSPHAGNLALPIGIHGGKASFAFLCHDRDPFYSWRKRDGVEPNPPARAHTAPASLIVEWIGSSLHGPAAPRGKPDSVAEAEPHE